MTAHTARRKFRNIRAIDVQHLWRMYQQGSLLLRPDFQRNAVWPTAAKSYLLDTLIRGLPTPLVFVYGMAVPDTGQPGLAVVDGQQRLSAIFDFLEGRFRLSGNDIDQYKGLRFDRLPADAQAAILDYGLVVEELEEHSAPEIRDIFTRLNRYGVRLTEQELRHAREDGAFKRTVEKVGAWEFWTAEGIISATKARRMRTDEFAAELLILLAEAAPQDKKAVVNQYYVAFSESFPDAGRITNRLMTYLGWTREALPSDPKSRFRKAVDFYSLIGAVDRLSEQGSRLSHLPAQAARTALERFADQLKIKQTSQLASRYLAAASRQTDNYIPRSTRIDVLSRVLDEAIV